MQPGISNYIKGSDRRLWVTEVEGYSSLVIKDLYDGIDLILEDQDGRIAYKFLISAGKDPERIRFAFDTNFPVKVSDSGELLVETEAGWLRHTAPFAYQQTKDDSAEVFFDVEEDGTVSFHLGPYDKQKPLVIDPTLVPYFSTYLGGSNSDTGRGVAVDYSGAIYVSGETWSSNFPTASAYQPVHGGAVRDAFVTKLDASGSSLVYSTYLGGMDDDWGYGIAVDSAGAAYVTGYTLSSDFPTTPLAFQVARQGSYDAFVTKLDASGSSVSYSTYLGGSADEDYGYAIAVDSTGNAYIAGHTRSTNFPTAAPCQITKAGGSDIFVSKLNSLGSGLTFSTFLGGESEDYSLTQEGLALDSTGAIYVTGRTTSANFPTTMGAFQGVKPGGMSDYEAFAAKLDPPGACISYSTYLGGVGNDYGRGIAVDSSGAAYLTGWTLSTNFPTISAYQTSDAGLEDAFVTKLDSAGSSLIYSTYLGGSAADYGTGIAVDSSGAAYVTGGTDSNDFPTAFPYQGSNAGGPQDAFVTKVNSTGTSLSYSTYLGGSDDDLAEGIALDSAGAVYVTGGTTSSDFPTTVDAFRSSNAGSSDLFVTKLKEPVLLSGTVVGGTWGSISVFSAISGRLVQYFCCMSSESFSLLVPASSCPSGGYKIRWSPPDSDKSPAWYQDKQSFSAADCVSAPSSSVVIQPPTASPISGTVRDSSTLFPTVGAVIYAYDALSGQFVGWGKSGAAGSYSIPLSSGSYKLKVVPPSGYQSKWYSNAYSFPAANLVNAPLAGVDVLVDPSGAIEGYIKDAQTAADLNSLPVYAYKTDGTFFGYALTDRGYGQGRYRLEAPPGTSLKLLASGGASYYNQWWSGASTFTEASPTTAPAVANFSLTPKP